MGKKIVAASSQWSSWPLLAMMAASGLVCKTAKVEYVHFVGHYKNAVGVGGLVISKHKRSG